MLVRRFLVLSHNLRNSFRRFSDDDDGGTEKKTELCLRPTPDDECRQRLSTASVSNDDDDVVDGGGVGGTRRVVPRFPFFSASARRRKIGLTADRCFVLASVAPNFTLGGSEKGPVTKKTTHELSKVSRDFFPEWMATGLKNRENKKKLFPQ